MITTALLVSRHKLKDGRRFGELSLRSITPGAADRIHEQLLVKGNKHRQRTAKLAMDVCRRAWGVAYCSFPTIVPAQNPFSKMGLSYKPLKTRAATLEELNSFVAKADELGYRSVGTAALIAFWWLQREEDIFLRLGWSHYRPSDAPYAVQILHNKTGESVDVPLYDQDGEASLQQPRRPTLRVLTRRRCFAHGGAQRGVARYGPAWCEA